MAVPRKKFADDKGAICEHRHMRMLALVLIVAVAFSPGRARSEPCRLALVMALDVSGSVNEAEYAQQLNGVAHALDSLPVRALILKGAGVDLAVFEWSSQNHQFLVQPWITLDSHAAIDRAVANVRSHQKKRAGLKTALSTALLFASSLLEERGHCWHKKIDVSSDGKNNIGPHLDQVYSLASFSGITVNALVVGDPASSQTLETPTGMTQSDLQNYFEQEVIRGPGAFSMIAFGYIDYARAMQKKLLRELQMPVVGSIGRKSSRGSALASCCFAADSFRRTAKVGAQVSQATAPVPPETTLSNQFQRHLQRSPQWP